MCSVCASDVTRAVHTSWCLSTIYVHNLMLTSISAHRILLVSSHISCATDPPCMAAWISDHSCAQTPPGRCTGNSTRSQKACTLGSCDHGDTRHTASDWPVAPARRGHADVMFVDQHTIHTHTHTQTNTHRVGYDDCAGRKSATHGANTRHVK